LSAPKCEHQHNTSDTLLRRRLEKSENEEKTTNQTTSQESRKSEKHKEIHIPKDATLTSSFLEARKAFKKGVFWWAGTAKC